MRWLVLYLMLAGCASDAPNHLGNPLTWPVQAITTGAQNGAYNHRRALVKTFVIDNHNTIQTDVQNGGGDAINTAMDFARVKTQNRAALIKELRDQHDLYFGTDPEPLVVALMVHGN
ncbi:hypothetical protein GCM10008927_03700 [Amylibacter ulvae]|uniref:Uncharacterized protein n=1 Tax=Paramylibacter ulvae TaxID=1651968 RepID=A0ABQ3CUW4_9RHOB|nr:hypothetical protein [Amylibacter ulvae]GHA42477.1 hypothetical protein GCM10008927_03700 [Amylibacter ulvae]